MSIFNRGIEIKKVKCPVCGKMFEASERQIFVPRTGSQGLMCRDCTRLMQELNEYKARLPKEKNSGKIKKISEIIKKLEKRLKI
ncbi:hypothetical protein J4404_02845 [Candidatus Woesearchaeota archaeon]|nr:hypothetical protein [Candidatus Woesearchaeota archaeon]